VRAGLLPQGDDVDVAQQEGVINFVDDIVSALDLNTFLYQHPKCNPT
jgi:hypothetical protein